jgi:predicted nucleic acid-binding protein
MASAVRRSVHRGRIDVSDGDAAFAEVPRLGVQIREPPSLHRDAWDLAKRFHRPAIYDSFYLALASIMRSELWTADLWLVNAVGQSIPWVRHI